MLFFYFFQSQKSEDPDKGEAISILYNEKTAIYPPDANIFLMQNSLE